MKKIIIFVSCFWILSCFAKECPQALPTDDPNFCASFKVAAECRCVDTGLPKAMCHDMKLLYDRMIILFKTQQNACNYQHDTTPRICNDDWNCYRLGGKDSFDRLCLSTGKSCQ